MSALAELTEQFWSWRNEQVPRTRDDLTRVERAPGWRPRWSVSDVADHRRSLDRFAGRLRALAVAPPGIGAPAEEVAAYVDARLLASAINRARFELDEVPAFRRDPWFWLDQSLGTVYDVLLAPPPFSPARLEQLHLLLEAAPGTLEAARQQLAGSAVRELAEAALPLARRAGADLRASLDALAAEIGPAALRRLHAAGEAASTALAGFAELVAACVADGAPLAGVGRPALERLMWDVALLPHTAEEVLAMGRQEFHRAVVGELLEQRRAPDAAWPELPASAVAQSEAEALAEEQVRAFLVSRGLLSQPAWLRRYLNRPRPRYIEALRWLGVSDDLTGPSRLDEDGVSYVPEPSPELPYFYRANAADPRAGIVHEGVHYQQLAMAWRHERAPRRHFYDSCPNEGIAFYNEEMVTLAGLFDGAPVTRRIIWNFMRLRALRVEADIRLALGSWSIAEGAQALARLVPMDGATAAEEAAFFAATPLQGSSYLVGKLQLVSLLAGARVAAGEAFDLQAAHDRVWREGNVPFALQRLEWLGDASELARVDELRATLDLEPPLVAPIGQAGAAGR